MLNVGVKCEASEIRSAVFVIFMMFGCACNGWPYIGGCSSIGLVIVLYVASNIYLCFSTLDRGDDINTVFECFG